MRDDERPVNEIYSDERSELDLYRRKEDVGKMNSQLQRKLREIKDREASDKRRAREILETCVDVIQSHCKQNPNDVPLLQYYEQR